MSLPPPDGFTERPLRRDDAALAAELLAEDERAFDQEPHVGEQDVLSWWLPAKLETDSWLVEEGGRPVALGWLGHQGDQAYAAGCVRPGWKERGLGAWLVARSEARAHEVGARVLHQFTTAVDVRAGALFEARGYRAARRHYEMVVELDAPPAAAQVPEGLSIDTFRGTDAQAWHAASAEAFADEWGFVSMPFDEWWAMRSNDPVFDPSLWFLVRDGKEIAALARCEAGRHGGGFVGMLAVRKPWRRRGLGLALLQHALREFYARGLSRVSLGVDSENPTGATRLYERAGMHVERESVTFEKALA